jgi:hypothetical protein
LMNNKGEWQRLISKGMPSSSLYRYEYRIGYVYT